MLLTALNMFHLYVVDLPTMRITSSFLMRIAKEFLEAKSVLRVIFIVRIYSKLLPLLTVFKQASSCLEREIF